MKLKRIAILLLFCVSLIGLTAIGAVAGCENSVEGVWKTEGYGWVLEISRDQVTIYETTEISGLKVYEGTRSGNTVDFGSGLSGFKLELEGGKLVFSHAYYEMHYQAKRLKHLPQVCKNGGTKATNDPVMNFNIFWRIFQEHYAFFQLRRVNWEAQYRIYRAQVTPHTTGQQLFDIMCQMVKPLQDSHVSITGPDNQEFNEGADAEVYQKAPEFVKSQAGTVAGKVERTVIVGALQGLTYRQLENNIGLITPLMMYGYGNTEDQEAYAQAIDGVIEKLASNKAIIIDMRYNQGGFDWVSRMLAGRFADRQRLAYRKQARDGAGYTPLRDFYVKPQGSLQYQGKVIVLTSRNTVSAGEIFIMCMQVLPNVTVMGERTNGAHSDVLMHKLPNGWQLGLSNERYYAADNRVYEMVGLQPDIQVDFDFQQILQGNDRVLEEAKLYAEK